MKTNFAIFFLWVLFTSSRPQTHDPTLPGDGIYRFALGEWKCTVINDGIKPLSLGGFFDSLSVQKLMPVVRSNHVDTSHLSINLNVLILQNKEHTIVIDPGVGKDIGDNTGTLMKHLRMANIDSAKVDLVIISHGHWDHFGGVSNSEGKINFPNAKYVMTKSDWDWWTSEINLVTVPRQWAQWARERLPLIKDKLVLLKGDEEIVPGLTAILAYGHTPGHMALLIHSASEGMLCIGDALHHPLQVEVPEACTTRDHDRASALQARNFLLEIAFQNKYRLFGFHFDFPGIGLVAKGEETPWKFEPLKTN